MVLAAAAAVAAAAVVVVVAVGVAVVVVGVQAVVEKDSEADLGEGRRGFEGSMTGAVELVSWVDQSLQAVTGWDVHGLSFAHEMRIHVSK